MAWGEDYSGGDGIASVLADTTPQLGGDLDVNGHSIVSVSDGDIVIQPNGTGQLTINDGAAPTKQLNFDLTAATAGVATSLRFVHTGNRTITFPNGSDFLVGRAESCTLTNKTLTTPTIGDLTNANHTHAAAGATGGTIAHTALTDKGTTSHAQIDTFIASMAHLTLLQYDAHQFIFDTGDEPRHGLAQYRNVLLFDHATADVAYTKPRVMPGQYTGAGTLKATIYYSMWDTATGSVYYDVAVEAITPSVGGTGGDVTVLGTTSSFDTDNAASDTVPETTTGKLGAITVTLENDDSVAAGDLVRFRVKANNTDTSDSVVYALEIWEDNS